MIKNNHGCNIIIENKNLTESEPFQRLKKTFRPPCNHVYFPKQPMQGGNKKDSAADPTATEPLLFLIENVSPAL